MVDRKIIFNEIEAERAYQDSKWGDEFDKLNTPNDWVAFIVKYTGLAVTLPWDRAAFRKAIIKVATLCVAALERTDYGKRHYD